MGFGNPYGDLWTEEEVVEAVGILADMSIRQISLADTVGLADAAKIASVVKAVLAKHDHLEIGVHLHSRPADAAEKILAAYNAGCRRFDSALAGLGGCPFAQDDLVGNMPTEIVVETLKQQPVRLPKLRPLDQLIADSRKFGAQFASGPIKN